MNQEKKEILTLKEAAELLRVSHITARRWCQKGKLPAVKLGNHYKIRIKDIDKLFEDKIRMNKDKNEADNRPLP